MRSRIRLNLPVVVEGLAFAECGNDNGKECHDQEYADTSECELVRSAPDANCNPLEKLRYRKLADPNEHGIEYPRCQHESGTDAAVLQLDFSVVYPNCLNIVRAVEQHNMYKCHSYQKRDESKEHNPIFCEELITPRLAPNEPCYNYGS